MFKFFSKIRIGDSLKLLNHFVRHMVIGAILFILLGIAAVVLKWFNDWLHYLGMPEIITETTHYLEIFIFAVDVVCYVFFAIVEAYVLCREIFSTAKQQQPSAPKEVTT